MGVRGDDLLDTVPEHQGEVNEIPRRKTWIALGKGSGLTHIFLLHGEDTSRHDAGKGIENLQSRCQLSNMPVPVKDPLEDLCIGRPIEPPVRQRLNHAPGWFHKGVIRGCGIDRDVRVDEHAGHGSVGSCAGFGNLALHLQPVGYRRADREERSGGLPSCLPIVLEHEGDGFTNQLGN